MFFKLDDFSDNPACRISPEAAAIQANRILTERGVRVFGYNDPKEYDITDWNTGDNTEDHTHQALLVCIEELPKPRSACVAGEHEPINTLKWDNSSYMMTGSFKEECKHCGVKLKAKWEVV